MPKLIDRNGERADQWVSYTGDTSVITPDSAVILPLAEFLTHADDWSKRVKAVGVALSSSDDPHAIATWLGALQLVTVNFPSFMDGRGYSIARVLRTTYSWRGELRAVGDIQRDQIFLLARTGFDTFALRDDQKLDVVNRGFTDFTRVYQVGVDFARGQQEVALIR